MKVRNKKFKKKNKKKTSQYNELIPADFPLEL